MKLDTGRLSFLSAALGLSLCFFYSIGMNMPTYPGVVTMFACAFVGAWTVHVSTLSLLPRFMVLLYTLPFAVLAGSLILSDFDLLNATAVELILQRPVASDALAAGLVGLLGLLAGFGLVREERLSIDAESVGTQPARILTVPLFFCFEALAVLLSGISSSSNRSASGGYFEDALDAAQGGGSGATLYVVSYGLMIVLCFDAQGDARPDRRLLKGLLLVAGVSYMTIFHQLLQGDREVLGLIVALLAMYLTRPRDLSTEARGVEQRRLLFKLLPIVGLAVVLFLAVGQLRYAAAGGPAGGGIVGAAFREIAGGGTWTAVFLGNLGLANEHQSGSVTYLFGKTYVDYLMSLLPGVVSRALGLVRPLEGVSGPGLWYYPLQWGGVHPVLVPFKNFGIWGVFAILMLYGYIIGLVERRGQQSAFWGRVLYGTFLAASFNWFWYGDMPFLRALMAAGIAGSAYQLILATGVSAGQGAQSSR